MLLLALIPSLVPTTRCLQDEPRPAAIELPMQMRGAMPAVEVRVNGEGPFLFAIDTCAGGMGRADSALVRQLGLPTLGQAAGGDGSGRSTAMQVVRLEYLEVGALPFEELDLPARDYNRPDLPRIHGILGFELFSKGVLTLDFPAKTVRYEPGAALPEPDGKEVLALVPGPVAALEIVVGDKKVLAHLDSGNLVGRFVFPSALVAELTLAGESRSVGKARTVTGEHDILQVTIREPITIGALVFPDESITHPSPGPTVNVGARWMADFRVSIDQPNGRVRFERPAPR